MVAALVFIFVCNFQLFVTFSSQKSVILLLTMEVERQYLPIICKSRRKSHKEKLGDG